MTTEKLLVAHIQPDFTESIKEKYERTNDNVEFFINIDKSLNSVKEFKIKILSDKYQFDAGNGNEFKKVNASEYKAVLEDNNYTFNAIVNDWTENNSLVNWTCVDITQTPEKMYLLGDSMGNIKVYNTDFLLEREFSEIHSGDITSAKFFPSGKVILSASNDMQLKVLSAEDGSNPRTFVGHKSTITDTSIIGRGRNILSSSRDGTIRFWECGSGSNIHTFVRKENPFDGVNSIHLMSDNINGKKSVGSINNSLEFETEGKNVLAGHSSGVITLHDIFSKEDQIQIPSEFTSSCNSVAQSSSNGNHIYAGYENGTLALWDLRYTDSSIQSVSVNKGTSINTIYYHNNSLFVSSGIDTCLKVNISSDTGFLDTKCPGFLVSNNSNVSQFTSMLKQDGSQNLIAVGNLGFCAEYNC